MQPVELDASISSLAPGGDGVALVELGGERRAVFVPHAAPGDRARLEVDPSRRPARGRMMTLVTAGRGPRAARVPVVDAVRRLRLDAPLRRRRRSVRTSSTCAPRCRPAWRDDADRLVLRARGARLPHAGRASTCAACEEARSSWGCTRLDRTSRSRSTRAPCSIRRSKGPGGRCPASSRARAAAARCRSPRRRPLAGARGPLGGGAAAAGVRPARGGRDARRDRGRAGHARRGDATGPHRRPDAVDDRRRRRARCASRPGASRRRARRSTRRWRSTSPRSCGPGARRRPSSSTPAPGT